MIKTDFSYANLQTKEVIPPSKFQIDPYKVSQVAAVAFALLAAADIVLRLGLSFGSLGLIATPVAWIIGGGVLVIGIIFVAGFYYFQERSHQKNYKAPEELQRLKEEAIELSFDELLREHTLNNLMTHIYNGSERSLSLVALQEKFQRFAQETFDFDSLRRNYDLDQLVKFQIVDQEFVSFLRSLERKMDAVQKKYQKDIRQLEKNYPLRLSQINTGISSVYDFFTDNYKIARTCIQYGMNAADLPKLQQIKYSRAEALLKNELKNAYAKIQEEYRNRCQDFFISRTESTSQDGLELEKAAND